MYMYSKRTLIIKQRELCKVSMAPMSKQACFQMRHLPSKGSGRATVTGLTGFQYFGDTGTGFPIHPENGDFFSVNYMNTGQPKVWYTIAQADLVRARQASYASYVSRIERKQQIYRGKGATCQETVQA